VRSNRLFLGLSFLLCAHAWAGQQTWITNVRLVSPERLDRIATGSVLIEGSRIVRVERGAGTKMPAGARRVDGKGYYLTPGLIDSHVHLAAVPGMSFDQAGKMKAMADEYFAQMPRSYLYFGYTTVIDLAVGNRAFIDHLKQTPVHPDIYDCGAPLVFANGYPMAYAPPETRFEAYSNFIYDPAQADKIPAQYKPEDHTPGTGVARVKADGGICVKTHFERGFGDMHNLPVMSPAVYADIRAEASKAGLVLITHANSFEAQTFAVDGGVDILAHGMWHWGDLDKEPELPPQIRQLLDKIVERKIGFQPTMQVLYGLRAYFDPAYLNSPTLPRLLPRSMLAWFKTPEGNWFKQEIAGDEDDASLLKGLEAPLRRQQQVVAYLASKHANFLFGTDTPSSPTYGNIPGLNGYLEMQDLYRAGMSLIQIFEAATLSNARAFKLDAELGTIEPGKIANLVLMKTSPLADIHAYDSVAMVWVEGKPISRSRLAVDK
jgi:imidazolonepropionase-like amidohydrolase